MLTYFLNICHRLINSPKDCVVETSILTGICALSFDSFPVIRLPIRHSASHRRDAVPTTALLGMMFSLRFLALLFQGHKLFHCDHHLPCSCDQ